MNEQSKKSEVFSANRGAVLRRLALAGFAVAILVYWYRLRNPAAAIYMTVALVAFLIYVLYWPARMLVTGVALIVTDSGLTDFTSGLGFLAWAEIRGVEIHRYFGIDLVDLCVADEDAILARLPMLRRAMWRYFIKNSGGAFNIKAGFVVGGAEPILKTIRDRAAGGLPRRTD
jgi:hypothetical protein